MNIEDLKRPDLEHTSCALCGEAWQSPEPPALPEGYLDAVDVLGSLAENPHDRVDAELVAGLRRIVEVREAQAVAYKLDAAAFEATHAHAAQAHRLEEHLEFAHANERPISCEKCGHEEQATAKGLAALKAHACKPGPKTRAYPG